MKKYKLFALLVVGYLLSGSAFAQPQLYIAMRDLSSNTMNNLYQQGCLQAKYVYGQYVYRSSRIEFMPPPFKAEIKRLYPDSLAKGICLIDWEGAGYEALRNRATDYKNYKQAVEQFILAIRTAKKLRPNVKWGFHAIPLKHVKGTIIYTDRQLENFNNDIRAILKECDVFAISAYDVYAVGDNKANVNAVLNDIKSSLKLGKKYNKPVMAVVWNRYANPRDKRMFQLMPDNIFLNTVRKIAAVNYQGKKIDGIIWWGGDSKFYDQKKGKIRMEASNREEFVNGYEKRVKRIVGLYYSGK